ncbi:MAG TPA: class I adenylate-forming enzyme family protein [Bryobacteraceae bacterium]|nr:class I adenylate-forming enzyme family protein [Bryobacteraceae bacterium]
MSLDRILAENSASTAIARNIITDGRFEYTYADLPTVIGEIRDHLARLGIDRQASVAIGCSNSVPSALLLLTLLQDGCSFLVFPSSATDKSLKPTPHFCQYRITVSSPDTNERDSGWPSRLIHVEVNSNHNGRPTARERLYLRTSGSMGISKIAVHTHEKLIGNARNCVHKYGFSPESRVAIPVPIGHMYGLGAAFLPAILTGSSIDLQDKTNVLKYLKREKQFVPTIVFGTPTICEMLLKGYRAARTHYDVFVTSGQRIGQELFRTFDPLVGGRLVNQYGSTEMGATAACSPGDTTDRRARTIGEPMTGVQLRIEPMADSNGPPSRTGQLECLHPFAFEGYIDENGDSLRRCEAGDWYATGDLAAAHQDGTISILGRADASANRSGYLVRLHEIEQILETWQDIDEAAVIAETAGATRGDSITAFCVGEAGILLDVTEIRRRCHSALPPYAVPDDIRVVEALPRLATGKVDRRALAEMAGKASHVA